MISASLQLRLNLPAFAVSNDLMPNMLGRYETPSISRLDLIAIRSKNIERIGRLSRAMEVSALKILERLRVIVGLTR